MSNLSPVKNLNPNFNGPLRIISEEDQLMTHMSNQEFILNVQTAHDVKTEEDILSEHLRNFDTKPFKPSALILLKDLNDPSVPKSQIILEKASK